MVLMNKLSFKITKKDSKTQARLGVLRTPHGTVQTPSYVMVATHAKIKALEATDIKKTKTQIVIANTYHLWDKALKNKRDKQLVNSMLGAKIVTMTDSGGFQVFSLGAAKEHNVGKVLARGKRAPGEKSAIKITEKGVYFTLDGEKRFLGPELSIEIQEKLGADIIFAFDECTSPLHSFTYNKQAMERTHRWAVRCLKAKKRDDQMLFGIVQGGRSVKMKWLIP
ncbi:MAG: tRNA-guanine transglycosylase [Candidatus Yanofskybacteria bacterium]|nr:tRNA-guanine transglycosylase [Candidatus Yanofskybacteria bacterium]